MRFHTCLTKHIPIHVVQTFIISRITYVSLHLKLMRVEIEENNRIIQKAAKAAVGIPISTATDRLKEMGTNNTLDQLTEAQRIRPNTIG